MWDTAYHAAETTVKAGVWSACTACDSKGEVICFLDLDGGASVYGVTCEPCPECHGTDAAGFWPFQAD